MLKKRIVSLIMVFVLSFLIILLDVKRTEAAAVVGALGGIATAYGTYLAIENSTVYQEAYDSEWWSRWRNAVDDGLNMIGLKHPLAQAMVNPLADPYQELVKYWKSKNNTQNDPTDKQIGDFAVDLNRDISIIGDTVQFGNDYKTLIKNYGNSIIENSGEYYAYTCDISKNVSGFTDQNKYNALKDFCEQYQSDNYIVNLNSLDYLVKMPKSEWNFVGGRTIDQYTLGYNVSLYNNNWQKPRFCDLPSGYIYQYNNGTYTQGSFYSATQAETWLIAKNDGICLMSNSWGGVRGAGVYTYHKVETVKVYQTLNDLKATSVGEAPYYITSNWQDFTNSGNTTYTVDSSNYNPVTYGDIVAYNQQYYDDHSYYPTTNTTQEWIDNIENHPMPTPTPTPTPNPQDPNGNGGGSVSGNGSGNSGNIFDWISDLGSVLGNLIKNIGNLIVSLIDSLVSVITTITEKIPNLFGDLLNFVFGGLPEEIRALIILGITCMVVYGIIKLIRG